MTSNIERNDRLVRAIAAVESVHIVGRAATPGVAADIAALEAPTVERIAGILYFSGCKGGKAAALHAAETILAAIKPEA